MDSGALGAAEAGVGAVGCSTMISSSGLSSVVSVGVISSVITTPIG
jgi:hypothetical protein